MPVLEELDLMIARKPYADCNDWFVALNEIPLSEIDPNHRDRLHLSSPYTAVMNDLDKLRYHVVTFHDNNELKIYLGVLIRGRVCSPICFVHKERLKFSHLKLSKLVRFLQPRL